MTAGALKQRVEARDHLADAAEAVGRQFEVDALAALRAGRADEAEAALRRGAAGVEALAEGLRVYQAELHAQAEELQASQQRTDLALARFASLFANLPVASLLVGERAEVVESNAHAQRLFEMRQRGSARRFFHRLVEPSQYQRFVRPAFVEARATGVALCAEVEFLTESGGRFWGELHIAAMPEGAGDGSTFACAVVDRTEHREMLRRLHETNRRLSASEAFLSDSAQLARIGGWEYDIEEQRLRWTAQTRAMHEVEADFVPTVDAAIGFYDAASQPLIRAAFEAALDVGRDFDLELDLTSARGRRMRVRAIGHPELRGGRCVRLNGVFHDITQQHQARAAIDTLTDRLNLAREAGGIGIWDSDLRLDRVYLDNGMRTLLGLERAPTGGLQATFDQVLDADGAVRLRHAIAATLRGEPLNLQLTLPAGDGHERHLHLTGRAELDAAGQPVRLIGCAWDSTSDHIAARLLAAKEAAESASRAKSAFLSRMSHELRTPLNAILGFAQLMRMEVESGDLTLKPHRVHFIETAARHLLDLINEVLDVSRIESGQMRLDLVVLDAVRLVQDSLPLVQVAADEAGVQMQPLDGSAVWVRADRLRLKEVLINLLSNAVKYNRRGGCVQVHARAGADGVSIEVQDTGCGLTPEQLDGLFQPFNRVGAEATRVEGSGMGLFVSKRFVELMGGTLAVRSTPEVGSVFTLTLPSAPSPAAVAAGAGG